MGGYLSAGLENLHPRVLEELAEGLDESLMLIFNKLGKFHRTGKKLNKL